MKGVPKESLRTALLMTFVAVLATVLVAVVDVQPVGVEGTNIGFASINTGFFAKYGYNETFYKISKFAGYLCYATANLIKTSMDCYAHKLKSFVIFQPFQKYQYHRSNTLKAFSCSSQSTA